jgi:fluoride exporter
MNFLLVFAGGGCGAALRYGTGLLFLRLFGATSFPWATFTINIVGCFLMGMLAIWLRGGQEELAAWRLLLGVGVLGGFTTFSSFALESVGLFEMQPLSAALYIGLSVVLGIAGLLAGMALARALI